MSFPVLFCRIERELSEMKFSLEDALSTQDKEGIAAFTDMIISTLDENDDILSPNYLNEMDEYMEDADRRGATVYLAGEFWNDIKFCRFKISLKSTLN